MLPEFYIVVNIIGTVIAVNLFLVLVAFSL